MPPAILELDDIIHVFKQGERRRLEILHHLSLELFPGELSALVGPSGSGKSTILHIAGLLERPTSGRVIINQTDTSPLNDKHRTRIRRENIGFVYQFHHLLPEFSALENVMLPQFITGKSKAESQTRAEELLSMVQIQHRSTHRPGSLSGGEQQRVALARALANAPQILLADEPTGNLDPTTAQLIFDIFVTLVRTQSITALIATHNLELVEHTDRVWSIQERHCVEHIPQRRTYTT